ncbi:phosphodiesterase [Dongshaea marina]|uniref:phosphodiesterase n=1 Tax=Dongshaea marina TaxID=2047966 RepID=UPI000D3ED860|nr:phosphodiesterase [Dongshaea marina]
MRLMFVSDIHGSEQALDQVLVHYAKLNPDYLVLLGDLLNHGPRNPLPEGYNPAAVAEKLNPLAQQIVAIRGNCDSEVDQMLLKFPCLAPYNHLLAAGRRLFLSHGHLHALDELPLACGDVLVTGHTHLPVAHREGEQYLFNPGSVTFPRGENPASFGMLEHSHLSVRALDDGRELLGCDLD